METRREDTDLAAELRALRPTPRPAFVAALDARAATGFPASPRRGRGGRAWKLPRIVPARRLPALAGAGAVAAIAVATAVVASSESGTPVATPPRLGHLETNGARPSSPESATAAPAKGAPSAASGGVLAAPGSVPAPIEAGAYPSHRDVERSAQIVLATGASEVRDAAAKVFEAVQAYHGIVMRSSIQDGRGAEAGASFDLLIPSDRLGEAMAAFSAIAEVRSRSESTADVTAPISGLAERLRDAQARVESLLAQLAGAETEAERRAVEAELRVARHRVAALRARLASMQRRTHLSAVSLRIEAGGDASRGAGWGIGRALRDAGHILSVAAGVTVIGLALLLPLVLIWLLALLGRRAWIRRSRERTLG
jgi:hypothetical protein